MGFPRRPRPRPTQQGSSSSSTEQSSQRSQSDRQPSKRLKLSTKDETIFDKEEMKAYIVVAKLTSSELDELNRAIVKNGGQVVSSYEEATVVISSTRLWSRLHKYLTNYEQEPKKILHTSWVLDSLAAGHQMPMDEKYLIHRPLDVLAGHHLGPGTRSATPSERALSVAPGEQEVRTPLPPSSLANEVAPVRDNVGGGAGRASPPKWRNRRFACERWHPLVCINQNLLLELRWIRDYNRLQGEERRSMTYSKAMAAIKSYPYPIKTAKEASSILGVGEKIAAQCEEYVKTGRIAAAEIIKKDPRMATLVEFTKIHGVGPTTARDLYDKYGCRTLADVEKISHKLPTMGEESILYVEEFDQRIPRDEVEWIAATVNDELQKIIPGAEYTIVGGYRRGKPLCGDVDIIFTHPEAGKEKGALEELLNRLQAAGWVTDVLYIALTDSQRDSTMKHFHASHMDPLDKAFTVWLSPANGTTRPKPIHRRLDLIFAPRKYYACAVLGWSGSTTFERDLRLYAEKNKGFKFDSGGLFKRSNSEEILVDTEKDIFDLLGLEYIPPEWRNCDI